MRNRQGKVKIGTTVRSETRATLQRHASLSGLGGLGSAIDDLACTVSGMSSHAAARLDKVLEDHIESRGAVLDSSVRIAEVLETRAEIKWLQQLQKVIHLYGSRHDSKDYPPGGGWRHLDLANGDYAYVPVEWDVFEESPRASSHYVYHAFMRNSHHLGIPEAAITTSCRWKDTELMEFFLHKLREKYPDVMKVAEANMVPEVVDPETGMLAHWDDVKASNNIYVVEIGDYRLDTALSCPERGENTFVVRSKGKKETTETS